MTDALQTVSLCPNWALFIPGRQAKTQKQAEEALEQRHLSKPSLNSLLSTFALLFYSAAGKRKTEKNWGTSVIWCDWAEPANPFSLVFLFLFTFSSSVSLLHLNSFRRFLIIIFHFSIPIPIRKISIAMLSFNYAIPSSHDTRRKQLN